MRDIESYMHFSDDYFKLLSVLQLFLKKKEKLKSTLFIVDGFYTKQLRNQPVYSTTLSIKIVIKSIAACAIFVPGPKIPTAPASNKN